MLAHDAPWAIAPHIGKVSLPEYLDYTHSGKNWPDAITAWHITTRDKLPDILKNGLRAGSCSDWMSGGRERPSAVYLFCARSVVRANIRHLLDNPSDAVVVQVRIPRKHVDKVYPDGIYNASIDAADMSSIQFRGDIPAKWITR